MRRVSKAMKEGRAQSWPQHSSERGDNSMYCISRIDSEASRQRAWRVSIQRHGKRHVKNFTDRQWGGTCPALHMAKQYRDAIVKLMPPLTRVEFASKLRRNNRSGISGVYTYAKSYQLKDGTVKQSWYWEATWPTSPGNSERAAFPVNTFGDEKARQLAICAREIGLENLKGVFWRTELGLLSLKAG